MRQNHLNTTLFKLCVLRVSDEHIYYILSSCTVPKLRYGPLTLNIKTLTTSNKITQAFTILTDFA